MTPITRRKKQLGLPPFLQPATARIEPETEIKLHSIMERNGLITINNVSYQTEIKDLDYIGDLGHGTSGSVVKMNHKATNTVIAVKVNFTRHQGSLFRFKNLLR